MALRVGGGEIMEISIWSAAGDRVCGDALCHHIEVCGASGLLAIPPAARLAGQGLHPSPGMLAVSRCKSCRSHTFSLVHPGEDAFQHHGSRVIFCLSSLVLKHSAALRPVKLVSAVSQRPERVLLPHSGMVSSGRSRSAFTLRSACMETQGGQEKK